MANKKYVTIKHKNISPKLIEAEYDKADVFPKEKSLSHVAQTNNINTNSSAPFEGLMKLASNNTIKSKLGGIVSSFEGVMKSGKIQNKVAETILLRYQTPLLRAIVSLAGYPSFTDLYNKIKVGGSGLSAAEQVEFIEAATKASEEGYQQESSRVNQRKKEKKKIDGIQINVIEEIEDSYDSEIPLKKVEAGFDITTAIHNKIPVYNFTGFIADSSIQELQEDGSIKTLSVEDIKKEIINIRDSKIAFDIEFSEEVGANGTIRKRESISNCYFSSLSFSRTNNNINGYDISFSVIPVVEASVEKVEKIITATKTNNIAKKKTTRVIGSEEYAKLRAKQAIPKDTEVINIKNLGVSSKYNFYKKVLPDDIAREYAGKPPREPGLTTPTVRSF